MLKYLSFFIIIFFISCEKSNITTSVSDKNIKNDEIIDFPKKNNITFVFDFDDTIYDTGKDNNNSYMYILQQKVLDKKIIENHKKYHSLQGQVADFIKRNLYLTKTQQGKVDLVKMIKVKFKIKFTQDNIIKTIEELQNLKSKNIDILIKSLIISGYNVKIIGGGTFGCAIIPEFVKDWGITRDNIYSGYGKTLQDSEIANAWMEEWRYANCQNLNEKTPYSEKKSDIVNYIKKRDNLKNHKIVMIGDGENDLETYTAKAVDYFIGFGLNKVDEKVKKQASVFVVNEDELIKQIQMFLKQINI